MEEKLIVQTDATVSAENDVGNSQLAPASIQLIYSTIRSSKIYHSNWKLYLRRTVMRIGLMLYYNICYILKIYFTTFICSMLL